MNGIAKVTRASQLEAWAGGEWRGREPTAPRLRADPRPVAHSKGIQLWLADWLEEDASVGTIRLCEWELLQLRALGGGS